MNKIPKIGMGTFGSDKYDEHTVANAVYNAIKMGYRLFDCASVYGNEKQIGAIFQQAINENIVVREDLYITSKVWNDMHGEKQVIESCEKTLSDLGLSYIDLYFVHWPFPNYHSKGCSVESRSKNSKPFYLDDFIVVWRQMEELVRRGLVKNIAMSNMTIPKFEAVLPLCKIKPYAHEMELHPSFQQKELFDYCIAHNIQPIAYCPIGSPNRPQRDIEVDDIVDTQIKEIIEIAQNRNWHPVEVCLKWAVQRGQIPIPFASKEKNLIINLAILSKPDLSNEEMLLIENADKNCRLVKGHVFLWQGAQDWHELWDEDGKLYNWERCDEKYKKIL